MSEHFQAAHPFEIWKAYDLHLLRYRDSDKVYSKLPGLVPAVCTGIRDLAGRQQKRTVSPRFLPSGTSSLREPASLCVLGLKNKIVNWRQTASAVALGYVQQGVLFLV